MLDCLALSPSLLACATLLIATWWWLFKRSNAAEHNLPPAPWVRIPVLGNLLQLMRCGDNMGEYFYDLSTTKEYNKVFTIYMGCHRTIILNHVDVIQEVLTLRQNDYADRPTMYSAEKMTDGGMDIAMGKFGAVWKHQRKVAQLAIKNYASGENLERMVDEALNITLESILKESAKGEAFNIKPHLVLLVMNTLAGVCFGKTYQLEDAEMNDFVDITREVLDVFNNGLPADFIPILQYLPTSSREKKIDVLVQKYFDFLEKHLKDHVEKAQSGSDQLNDLTDYLLWHTEQEEKDASNKNLLTQKHLLMTVFDVFGAGIDTIVTSLHYFIGHMLMNPEVEARMVKEIEDVIGAGPVLLSHRTKMPYTEACMKENQRRGSVLQLGIPLVTTCDTKIDKYDVPKGTLAMVNYWALHNDPEQWHEPSEFRPERFLDAEGNLGPKPRSYYPFAGGRRVCLGEGLAKSTLMMVIPKLYQALKISSPLGDQFRIQLDTSSSLMSLPQPYDVIVEQRK